MIYKEKYIVRQTGEANVTERDSFSYRMLDRRDKLYLMGKVGVFPTVGENMKNDVTQADIDHLKSLSEKELRELFKKVDWSDIDPTIEEIENELERDVDRYMSLTAKEYRNEIGIKRKKKSFRHIP